MPIPFLPVLETYAGRVVRYLVSGGLWSVLAFVIGISGMAHADTFVRNDIILDPSPVRFSVCHGNGCTYLSEVTLKPEQWAFVAESFDPAAPTPEAEREQIRIAIARMERYVGVATGTSTDRAKNARSPAGPQAEMDCIDESINTTSYLTMFINFGLVRHHRVQDRATRGWFIAGWPHTSAVMRDRTDGSLWAVDSWFLDNGEPPFIVPLEIWRAGWEPEVEPAAVSAP